MSEKNSRTTKYHLDHLEQIAIEAEHLAKTARRLRATFERNENHESAKQNLQSAFLTVIRITTEYL